MEFVNLFVKTEYSMLDSTCAISRLVEKASEIGCTTLGMCDNTNMHGAIKFYDACVKKNIKPIIGLKVNYRYNDIESCLLLYAINNIGYQNLMKISSRSKIQNGYVELEYLEKASLGVVAVTAGRYNFIYNNFEQHPNWAIDHYCALKNIFSFLYIGITKDSKYELDKWEKIKKFIRDNRWQPLALHEVACVNKDEHDALNVLKTIKNPKHQNDLVDYSLLTNDEYFKRFNDYPEAISNTLEIKRLSSIYFKFDEYLTPSYSNEIDSEKYLLALCMKGLEKRLADNLITNPVLIDKYQKRLNYELQVIHKMGFDDYFLIVWDYVKFAKKEDIYVGPGRGSAPASLVSYCLGITDIDPIKHQLLFERFLNAERVTMPDIDIDFPDDRRDEVIKYVGKKYGKNRVAHIVTFGCYASRSAIRDASKVLKLNDVRLKEILKCVSKDPYTSLSSIYEQSEKLRDLCEKYDDIKKVVQIAMKIEGLPRNTSTHAAGIVMTKEDLVNYTPLDVGLDDIYQTQYEAVDLERLGLLKNDFLGLRNLTNIKNCIDSIKLENPAFVMPKEYNDPKTFRMIAEGDTMGVFQLESVGIRKVLRDLKVSSFEDITNAIALYRPGPMDIIPNFIKRKFGEEKVIYPHPDLEPILKSTYGTIVYQDQIMLIAWRFAGYSLGQADILRRAVSKKKKEVLEAERINFVSSSVKQGYTKEVAEEIYDYIVKFANYGFNKAHSVAYAVIAYETAYLKANYPEHYFSSLMSSVIGSDSSMNEYITECRKLNIKVIPPSINRSSDIFISNNHQIIYPLSGIMGLGVMKTKELLLERQKGLFKDFEDFVVRSKNIISSALLENIIYSGALDEFGLTKKAMISTYKSILNKLQYSFINQLELLATDYDIDEYSYGYLLEKEKEILGLNIKYNFMFQYQHLYKNPKLLRIKDAKKAPFAKVLGIVKKIKEIKTSNGENMAFCTIYDDSDTIEVTLFPKQYEKLTNFSIGQVYEIEGKIEKRKNQLQILVENMHLI
ncbi:MAG: DNA polymerase III subunit alpha [Bacilli bacterium]|nr:DNA polymerase III subunit alpha [Bacilli bacterium]